MKNITKMNNTEFELCLKELDLFSDNGSIQRLECIDEEEAKEQEQPLEGSFMNLSFISGEDISVAAEQEQRYTSKI